MKGLLNVGGNAIGDNDGQRMFGAEETETVECDEDNW